MPTPHPDKEAHAEWMDRCIPVVLDDNTANDQKQAIAICMSMWNEAMESKDISRMDSERRHGELSVEMRQENGVIRISGHAAVFDQEVMIAGVFREVIRRGAFTQAIGRDDVSLLIEHQGLPLARTRSGTLRLSEDARGLFIESELASDDLDVQRIVPKMRRGDLDKMSFSFQAVRQQWDESTKVPLRILEEVRLHDVSLVTMPAYSGTDVALRSLEDTRRVQKAKNFGNAERRKYLIALKKFQKSDRPISDYPRFREKSRSTASVMPPKSCG